jgi:hypothetical protein
MQQPSPPRVREERTIVIDFHDEATYFGLLDQGKAFLDFVVAFILSTGFQLRHKSACSGGFCLTRHSHYMRVRLGGVPIWRLQCTVCKAVFTVLPHFVLRYRAMRPDVARHVLLATHGGLSLELCAILYNVSPMAMYRLVCALGRHGLVPALRQAARQADPEYRVRGILTAGFESTIHSMRALFPQAAIGNCLPHAMKKVPTKLPAISSALRQQLSRRCTQIFDEVHQRAGQRVLALGQKLRCCTEYVGIVAGQAQRLRLHEWMMQKKSGWYAVYANRQMPRWTWPHDRGSSAIFRAQHPSPHPPGLL